jgi:hypothetical protein
MRQVDATSAYWSDYGSGMVMKAPLGGGTAVTLATGVIGAFTLAVDQTSVYWVAEGNCLSDAGTCPGTVMKVTPK